MRESIDFEEGELPKHGPSERLLVAVSQREAASFAPAREVPQTVFESTPQAAGPVFATSAGDVASEITKVRGWLGGREVSIAQRAFEVAVAASVLVLTLPLMIALAVVVKLGTPGPVLFFQRRVGKDGRLFTFVKFRTMYTDARERFPELYAYRYTPEDLNSLKFKVEEDPRVTPQGRWLRRTSLDELPNFWNVLTGDMALVGPRPEIPEMLPYYPGLSALKFSVRPGVTGLAQVSGRGHLSFRDTVRLDLEYARKASFLFDLKLILKTLKMVALGNGAF